MGSQQCKIIGHLGLVIETIIFLAESIRDFEAIIPGLILGICF